LIVARMPWTRRSVSEAAAQRTSAEANGVGVEMRLAAIGATDRFLNADLLAAWTR
jgi:hypothetical protein